MTEFEVSPAAEALWLQHLSRRLGGEPVSLEDLRAAHPRFAQEFERLEHRWLHAEDSNDRPSNIGDEGLARVLERLSTQRRGVSSYETRGRIGQGGMGVVQRVWDETLRRELAMKTVHERFGAAREQALARFIEEAQITGQLDHPGIVPVHELGLDSAGQVYFTMKLVEGENLDVVFEHVHAGREGWSQVRALNVLLRVCEALAFAHSRLVIHRDLKPANVMVGRFGEVYVMDWGVARVLGRTDKHAPQLRSAPAPTGKVVRTQRHEQRDNTPDSPLVTKEGDIVGTPSYMPPEQARGELDKLGPHSDVYSVGAMLYQLLTGRRPYAPAAGRASTSAILAAVLRGAPESIESLAPSTPPELVAIAQKAMERAIDERYPTTSALADDLRDYLEGRVVAAYETGAWAEASKWVKRNKPLAASLAAAVLALIGGTVFSVSFAREAGAARIRAERGESQALDSATAAQLSRTEAEQKTNDVLALSAQKDHDDLVAEAAKLWPAHPEMIPRYEDWLRRANELIDGRPADDARGLKKRPSLAEHKAKLAELRAGAKPLTEEQIRAERESHPKYAELQAKQAERLWRSRMLGDEPWPSEAAVEAELANESLPTDADALNALAWALVDPAKPVYGQEVRALLLARRAVAAASEDKRSGIRDTLAWALFKLGRMDESLAEERAAMLGENGDDLKSSAAELEEAVAAWRVDELAKRRESRDELAEEVASLSSTVRERRTYEFEDSEKDWWNRSLSKLVSDLESLRDPATGLMHDVLAEPFGWGVAKRYEFAKTIGERSVDGPDAKRLWSEAIAAIKASSKYGGLEIVPQIGLLPIGMDPDSSLWEFAQLQTGEPAVRGADGKLVLSDEMGLVLVLIPGGAFWMGAQSEDSSGRNYDPRASDHNGPVHEVELSPYFLSKFEMTQKQWQRIAVANPSFFQRGGLAPSRLRPVEQVSWPMCVTVLERLGLSLPSEAQWECGARGGTTTTWWTGQERETLRGKANLADQTATKAHAPYPAASDWPDLEDGCVVHCPVTDERRLRLETASRGRREYHDSMDYSQIITIEPGKRGGKPCIRGMRITVYDVLEYLASGMSEDEILSDFPDLTRDDIRACLQFAADRERRLMGRTA